MESNSTTGKKGTTVEADKSDLPSAPIISSTPEVVPAAASATEPKHKTKKIAIIVAIAIMSIAAIIGAVFLVLHLAKTIGRSTRESLYAHDAYFLPESAEVGTKYALIGKDGKELTKYEIEKYEPFVDGYALFKNEEGWGTIDDSGNIAIKPGEYDGLSRLGGLYSSFKPGDSERRLLHGSGREVTTFESSKNGDTSSWRSNPAITMIRRDDKKYEIYNAHGDKIADIESAKTPVISTNNTYISSGAQSTHTAISYSGGLIILTNRDLKEILRSDDVSVIYEIKTLSKDGSKILFSEAASDSQSNSTYRKTNEAYYTNGRITKISDICSSPVLTSSELAPAGYIQCYSASGSGFIDGAGKFHAIYSSASSTRYQVIDADHYALYDSKKREVTFNGQTKLKAANYISAQGSNYVMTTSSGKDIYDKNGSKICTIPRLNDFEQAFDQNGVGVFMTYDKETGYYLADSNCERISDIYYSITGMNGYYLIRDRDNKMSGLIDKTGKERIEPGEYSSMTVLTNNDKTKKVVEAGKADGTRVLFNENFEKIAEFKGSCHIDSAQDMIVVYGEKYMYYYTFDGTELGSVQLGEWARTQT